MSSYLQDRVAAALRAANGNTSKAQMQLLSWALKDPELMIAMTKPYLKAIALQAVSQPGRRRIAPPEPRAAKPQVPGKNAENFAADLLGAIRSGGGQTFGHDNAASAGRRKQASQQHVSAISKIARKVPKKPVKF